MRISLALLCAVGAVAVSAKADAVSALHAVYAKARVVELADADADGLADATEAAIGSDPAVTDTDGDGLLDGDEEILLNTSAVLADGDGDGFGDGLEVAAGSDPLSATSFPVTVSGRIVSDTPFVGNVWANLSVSNAFGFIAHNTATAQVCRAFTASGCPAAFIFTNAVASGAAFRIDAWADVNTNGVQETWEPAGRFVSVGVGADLADVEISLAFDDSVDADGNGLADAWEWRHFGSLGNVATADPDHDGLDNAGECRWGTDPHNDDTDNDGMTDGDEVYVGFNPAVPDRLPSRPLSRLGRRCSAGIPCRAKNSTT